MTLSGFASVLNRRTVVTLALAAGLAAGWTAWTRAAQEKDDFKFSSDAAIMVYTVKADGTGDFESMWTAIKTKLTASDKPELKALGESLRWYKVEGGPTPDGQIYFFVADAASKTTSYGLSPFLLFNSQLFTRAEADELFKKVNTAIVGLNAIPLKKMP